jgi:cytochrome oxidase Cu insertion factor (SCO1/SenC/PrrC family)
MAEEEPTAASSRPPDMSVRRIRRGWALAAAAALAGVGAGAGLALVHHGRPRTAPTVVGRANVVWPAATRRAPDFTLRDQGGSPISLRAARGRVVILTFIDPVCTSLCPLEAKVLDQVERALPRGRRPAIVAVSVNPWADKPLNFRRDARKWRLDRRWRWALGSRAELARVWRAYAIGVRVRRISVPGLTVHEVDHTEASYLIDGRGFERALFTYPFAAADVEQAVRRLE